MKKSDVFRLRELVGLCEGHKCYEARLLPPCRKMPADPDPNWGYGPFRFDWDEVPFLELQWGLKARLDNGEKVFWAEQPWSIENWPTLDWAGSYFFHRSCAGVYLVQGTVRDFNGSIYRPRLRGFKKMVRWAIPEAEVGFTTWHMVKEHWGYMLVSPWLIKSTDPVWLQRVKMFNALNEFNPRRWPMSLLIENWPTFREIRF